MHDFTYHTPATLAEAIALMQADPANSRYLAGGTDLYLALEHGAAPAGVVIDLKGVAGLDGIVALPEGGWRIGALTRMADIEHHAELQRDYPSLCAAAEVVGGPPIRNRATLGGNLCNASPAADTSTPLLALGATVAVSDGEQERTLPLAELWRGPRQTTLAPSSVLTAIMLPPPAPRSDNAFQRLTRSAMDIAVVNAAVCLALDEAGCVASLRVALGAVAPVVVLVEGLESALAGKPVDEAACEQVRSRAQAAARPIDDVRASAAYRAEMAGTLAMRALQDAAAISGGAS